MSPTRKEVPPERQQNITSPKSKHLSSPFPTPVTPATNYYVPSWYFSSLLASHNKTPAVKIPGTWNMGPLWGGGRMQWDLSLLPSLLTLLPVGGVSTLPPINRGIWRGSGSWDPAAKRTCHTWGIGIGGRSGFPPSGSQ